MKHDDTRVLSRETIRSRPVPGGKKTCARCDVARLPGSSYCRTHKQEWDRSWRKRRTEELRQLRAEKRAAETGGA